MAGIVSCSTARSESYQSLSFFQYQLLHCDKLGITCVVRKINVPTLKQNSSITRYEPQSHQKSTVVRTLIIFPRTIYNHHFYFVDYAISRYNLVYPILAWVKPQTFLIRCLAASSILKNHLKTTLSKLTYPHNRIIEISIWWKGIFSYLSTSDNHF